MNTMTRCTLATVLLLTATLFAEPATAPSTQPATQSATQPTTQAATGLIKGHVSVSGALSLTKPDLTRVVVYLASDPVLDAVPHVTDHATVEQIHKSFSPNFSVVPRDTNVEFPNWDTFDHNVFSRSKAAPAFDLDRYPRGQSKSRVFDKIGVVQVFCNIHPSMRAIIYVTPNIYFARCDCHGNFAIKDVPVGKYDLLTWNERCGETRTSVTVSENASVQTAITLFESRKQIVDNTLKSHDGGYGVVRGLGMKRERLDLPVVQDAHIAIDPEK